MCNMGCVEFSADELAALRRVARQEIRREKYRLEHIRIERLHELHERSHTHGLTHEEWAEMHELSGGRD